MSFSPSQSWSVQFAREWWPYLTPSSIVRWRDTVLKTRRGELPKDSLVVLKFKAPVHADVALRGAASDTYTMREILVQQVYGSLPDVIVAPKTIIDLGANIGLASLYFGTIFPACRIFAVEPLQENVTVLARNLKSMIYNGRAVVLQAAVWSHEVELELNMADAGGFDSVIASESSTRDAGAAYVSGLPMGTIIERSGFNTVDLLKVDIEGAEVQLFSGDTSWLKSVNAVAVEFHGDARSQCAFDKTMLENQFTVTTLNSHTVVAVRPTRV